MVRRSLAPRRHDRDQDRTRGKTSSRCGQWLVAHKYTSHAHLGRRRHERRRHHDRPRDHVAAAPVCRSARRRRRRATRCVRSSRRTDRRTFPSSERVTNEAGFNALYAMDAYEHVVRRDGLSGRHADHGLQRSARLVVGARQVRRAPATRVRPAAVRFCCASTTTRATAFSPARARRASSCSPTSTRSCSGSAATPRSRASRRTSFRAEAKSLDACTDSEQHRFDVVGGHRARVPRRREGDLDVGGLYAFDRQARGLRRTS